MQLSLLAHQVDMAGTCCSDGLFSIFEACFLTSAFLLLIQDVVIMCPHTLGKLIISS